MRVLRILAAMAMAAAGTAWAATPTAADTLCGWDGAVDGDAPSWSKPFTTWGNVHAVCDAWFVPGLQDHFVPQGISLPSPDGANGVIFVSGYRLYTSGDERCVVAVMVRDLDLGRRIFPHASCNHGGGIATTQGFDLLADTDILYRTRVADNGSGPVFQTPRTLLPSGGISGSFLIEDGTDRNLGYTWIGRWEQRTASQLYGFSNAFLDGRANGAALRPKNLVYTIPNDVQGGFFDGQGRLFVAASHSQCGLLYRVDPSNGAVLGVWEMPPGVEEISFHVSGGTARMAMVSEAGAWPFRKKAAFWPLVTVVDPSLLIALPNTPNSWPAHCRDLAPVTGFATAVASDLRPSA